MAHIVKPVALLVIPLACCMLEARPPEQAQSPARCYELTHSSMEQRVLQLGSNYSNPLLGKSANSTPEQPYSKREYAYKLQYRFKGKKIRLVSDDAQLLQLNGNKQDLEIELTDSPDDSRQGSDSLYLEISADHSKLSEKIELATTLYVQVCDADKYTGSTISIPFNSASTYKFENLSLESFKLGEGEDAEEALSSEGNMLLADEKTMQRIQLYAEQQNLANYLHGYQHVEYETPIARSYTAHSKSSNEPYKQLDDKQKIPVIEKINKATSGYTYNFQTPLDGRVYGNLESMYTFEFSDENDKPLKCFHNERSQNHTQFITNICTFNRPSSKLNIKINKYDDWQLLSIPLRVAIAPSGITVLED